jgi:hypothetical protein
MRMLICFYIPHNIVNRWNNYFYQLVNVHTVSDVGQIEVHSAEPLVPGTRITFWANDSLK